MFAKAKPRVGVISHMSYDHLLIPEAIDQIRSHWKGPNGLGMPDLVVFNVTKDAVWQRMGVLPDDANVPAIKFDKEYLSKLRFPKCLRKDVEQQWLIDTEIAPELYYPKDHVPKLVTEPPPEWYKLKKGE